MQLDWDLDLQLCWPTAPRQACRCIRQVARGIHIELTEDVTTRTWIQIPRCQHHVRVRWTRVLKLPGRLPQPFEIQRCLRSSNLLRTRHPVNLTLFAFWQHRSVPALWQTKTASCPTTDSPLEKHLYLSRPFQSLELRTRRAVCRHRHICLPPQHWRS
jgi:hypothetical protein